VRISLQQPAIDDFLKPADLQAHRRLAAPNEFGRAGKAARVDRFDERSQQFDRNILHGFIISLANDTIDIINFSNVNFLGIRPLFSSARCGQRG
jgi:hypothetical protein